MCVDQYYTRIRLTRMSSLLALSEAETEDCLADMVVAGTVTAKTDRLAGIVDFSEQQVGCLVLNLKSMKLILFAIFVFC